MNLDELRSHLAALVGPERVLFARPDLVAYAADMWPRTQIWKLAGTPARHPPDAVVRVRSREQLLTVMERCRTLGVPVIPYGAGSGVCGGTLPVQGGVVIDLKGMNRILALSHEDRTVTVEAGAIGQELERALNEAGFTLGHFPSSLFCSTVGGYAAARSAGQYSSRYGTFEDLVLALTVALPNGKVRTITRDAPGPDWQSIFIGNEGTLGFILDVTLRLSPLPETAMFRGFRLRNVAHGTDVMRRLLQAGLRPNVLRLYDPFDTIIAASEPHAEEEHAAGGDDGGWAARLVRERLTPLRYDLERRTVDLLLTRPGWLNRLADRVPLGCLLIAGFEGSRAAVERDAAHAWSLIQSRGGEDRGRGPGEAWHQNRFAISFKQSKVFLAGAFVDTMEVSTTWDNLVPLYDAVRQAVRPHAFIMAHFSHAYREGCSIYFTMAGRARSAEEGEANHRRLWQEGLAAVVRAGASISHHHGIGYSKAAYLPAEFGHGGRRAYLALKAALDPQGLLNPQKLWLRPKGLTPPEVRSASMTGDTPRVDPQSQTLLTDATMPMAALEAWAARAGYALPLWRVGADRTLTDSLTEPARLDWGPLLGGVRDNVLALEATLLGGATLTERPAPRRPAGPDLLGLVRGGGGDTGAVSRALLRVFPRAFAGAPHTITATTPVALLAVLRGLMDEEALPLRATIAIAPSGATLWLLPRADQQALARAKGFSAAAAGSSWPTPGPRGFLGAPYLTWSALAQALAALGEAGGKALASRFDAHGAFLVITKKDRALLAAQGVELQAPVAALATETAGVIKSLSANADQDGGAP